MYYFIINNYLEDFRKIFLQTEQADALLVLVLIPCFDGIRITKCPKGCKFITGGGGGA